MNLNHIMKLVTRLGIQFNKTAAPTKVAAIPKKTITPPGITNSSKIITIPSVTQVCQMDISYTP